MIAERIVYKLVELHSKKQHGDLGQATGPGGNIETNPISSLEVIGESGIEEQLISHRINVDGQQPKTFTGRRRSSNHQSREEEEKQQSNKFASNSL